MLTRLETLYLGILRVVILIIATLALLAAAISLASVLPSLLRHSGAIAAPDPHGGTLGEFITEKKASVRTDQPRTESDATSTPTDEAIDPDLAAAARALQQYTHGANGLTVRDWRRSLQQAADRAPGATAPAYLRSIHRLTDQLLISKGRPLTPDQVAELLTWHEQRFAADVQARSEEQAADSARSVYVLYAAASAFVLFLLITFVFLFVRIERSLRLVRTRAVENGHA